MDSVERIEQAAAIIRKSRNCIIFSGAGISVESGIPAFRGKSGLWQKYNPDCIELSNFQRNPEQSWRMIKEIFYDFMGSAEPNPAHYACAELEKMGKASAVITQNIDALHSRAGSKAVYEFHGTLNRFVCTACNEKVAFEPHMLKQMPPRCSKCGAVYKPDFVFFSEQIDPEVYRQSQSCCCECDCMIIIGTSGEVMPACSLPHYAHRNGAEIIEINPQPSAFTNQITKVYISEKASLAMWKLVDIAGA